MIGMKYDKGKPQVGLVFESFPRALLAVAEVAGFGAKKYTRNGWKEVPDAYNRYKDALGRHLLQREIESNDNESHLDHLAHLAWNTLAILELEMLKNETNHELAKGQEEFDACQDLRISIEAAPDKPVQHKPCPSLFGKVIVDDEGC